MVTGAAPSIALIIGMVIHICLPTTLGIVTIANNSSPIGTRARRSVEKAIRETCSIRRWHLQTLNVRTTHVHTVVTANRKPALVLNAFKANATRHLREHRLWPHQSSPWADKGSKIRLWNERSVANAIEYVLNGQGNVLPRFED